MTYTIKYTTVPVTTNVVSTRFGVTTNRSRTGVTILGTMRTRGKMADHVARNYFQRTGTCALAPDGVNQKSKPLLT
jgi:hypothetical protein